MHLRRDPYPIVPEATYRYWGSYYEHPIVNAVTDIEKPFVSWK